MAKWLPDFSNKTRWLAIAEAVDALRIFPRLLLLSDFVFTCWYCWYSLDVVVTLVTINSIHDAGLIGAVSAVMVSATVPFITHRFSKIADIYLNTGRSWNSDEKK